MTSSVKNTDLAIIENALRAKPFVEHRLFRGAHRQTLLGYVYPRRRGLQRGLQNFQSRFFAVEPGVQLMARCHWQPDQPRAKPTLLLIHGLEGSSDSVYIVGTAATAFAAGFNVLRLNLRTCGDTEHLTKTLYHSGMSADLLFVINELIERDRLERIFLAGFSLGGNISLKLAGEISANAPAELRGVCAVSPSIDLAACAAAIEQRSNWLYNKRFVTSLKARMRRIQKLNPEIYDINDLDRVRTVRDFDRHFTARYNGFRDTNDYYERSSALRVIENIRVPTLIIHAKDDPFVPFEAFKSPQLIKNPNIILLAPAHGGHVGFVADKPLLDKNRFWAENRIVEFCRSLQQ